MHKKVLLVGSSYSAMPMFNILKNNSCEISVCGSKPDDPCQIIADHNVYIDYSDRDLLLDHISHTTYDYIVPSCNDVSYMSTAWALEKLGLSDDYLLDDFQVSRLIHIKSLFKQFLQQNNFPTPQSYSLDSARSLVSESHPLIVKPIDCFSGVGVNISDSLSTLESSVESALSSSRTQNYLIEDYIEGQLVSHSAFLSDQQIYLDFFVDEYCNTYKYQVDCSCHPSSISSTVKSKIRSSITRLASMLKLKDGLLHTQFICKGTDVFIIESMRRAPGDLYGELVKKSSGINYWELYTTPFISNEYITDTTQREYLPVSRHTISSSKLCTPFSFVSDCQAREIEFIPLHYSGHPLNAAPFDKAAIVLATWNDSSTMYSYTPKLNKLFRIRMF